MQSDWAIRTAAELHELSDELALADIGEFMPLLCRSLDRIELSPDAAPHHMLRLMLLDLCRQIVAAIHACHAPRPCSCYAASWKSLGLLTQIDDGDPRTAIRRWMEQLVAQAAAEHPSTPAQRAAALIRANPCLTWTLHELANQVGAHHVQLSRHFREFFGLSPTAYVHLVRVARAAALFRTPAKVEAIAWEVGYRSKKDFYAALKCWIGLTPSELRMISDDESRWLVRQLRRRGLTRGGDDFAIVFAREPSGTRASRRPLPRRQSARPLRT